MNFVRCIVSLRVLVLSAPVLALIYYLLFVCRMNYDKLFTYLSIHVDFMNVAF